MIMPLSVKASTPQAFHEATGILLNVNTRIHFTLLFKYFLHLTNQGVSKFENNTLPI